MFVAFLECSHLTVEIRKILRKTKTRFGKSHIPLNVLVGGERMKVNLGHDSESLADRRFQLH